MLRSVAQTSPTTLATSGSPQSAYAVRRPSRNGVRGESNDLFDGPEKHGYMDNPGMADYNPDGVSLKQVGLSK